MHLHFIMCFSSSIICLLVVTCHGSIINVYDSEHGYRGDEDGSRIHDTSHISSRNLTKHNKTSSDIHHQLSNFHSKPTNQDMASFVQGELVHISERSRKVSKENNTNTKRKPRGATEKTVLPPLLNHEEENILSGTTQQGASSSNGLSHSHHANNTDHGHDHHQPDTTSGGHRHENHETLPHNKMSRVGITNHQEGSQESLDPLKVNEPINVNPCEDKHEHQHEGEVKEDEHGPHEPSADFHQHYKSSTQNITGKVWLYSTLAVVVISLCGLISVAVIPIMQKWFYHTLLQFLVGLAVGSLSGDGLLHLMPHAILDGEDSHNHSEEGHHHTSRTSMQAMEIKAIWRGLAALAGIFLFFIAERLLGALTTYKRQKKEAKLSRHTKNMIPMPREDGANNGSVGEKLAQPKKNSYDHIREKDEKETIQMLQSEASPSKKGSNQSIHEVGFHGRSSFSIEPEVTVAYRPDSDSSVVVSEHHGHGHAHTHEIPQSVSAVAWMVIMGDGLHNFCDGLAIGAAFASGDADGISTTVAVFCHELPHELGDFAMLLKTGMKVKQALFYNGLSSVLCFVGMVIGVSLGNVHSATNWVFAGTAGMFLYIALVDMLPELTLPANSPGTAAISTLVVQVLGICIGICIMLLIALYEHELHSIVS